MYKRGQIKIIPTSSKLSYLHSKRAQITVFIIIGIVLIAVFGFIFSITKEVSKAKLETEANRIIDAVLATTSLNYYVTLCVEESTKSSLNLVGDHGGPVNLSIYPTPNVYFNGSGINLERFCKDPATPAIIPCEGIPYNVSYSIMRWNAVRDKINNSNNVPDINLTPCHPRMGLPYKYNIFNSSLNRPENNCITNPKSCESEVSLGPLPNWNVAPFYCGFRNNINEFKQLPEVEYGRSDYTLPLCKPGQCLTDVLKVGIPFTTKLKSINVYAGAGATNIQEQMEDQIAGLVKECVRFDEVEAFRAFNITKEEVFINLTLADNGIEILATFPLTIKIQDYEPVIRVLQFKSIIPVRLKPVYKLARYLAEKENTDLNFSIERDWNKSMYYNSDFTLEIIKSGNRTICSPACVSTPTNNVVPGGARIIRINDTNPSHFLRNGPFTYQFAIQNRPPVLDYIGDSYPPNPSLTGYDIVVVENQTITIRPNATDPDDDKVSYVYSGWKETWDEEFDEDLHTDCRQNAENCMVRDMTSKPRIWTRSSLYHLTRSAANYTTSHADIGPHQVTVCAVDSYWLVDLRDCQTIRILVDDVFQVKAVKDQSCTLYGSVDSNASSFEDPLCLEARVTDYFGTGSIKYEWSIRKATDTSGAYKNFYVGDKSKIIIPLNSTLGTNSGDFYYDIKNIKGFFNQITPLLPDVYQILLKVTKNPGPAAIEATDELNSTFYQCLSHSSSVPSFPFDGLENHYLADHSCCTPSGAGGVFKNKGTVCYTSTSEYGCYFSDFEIANDVRTAVSNVNKTAIIGGNKLSNPTFNITDLDNEAKNDVFVRYLNGTCSGTRGNTCTGDLFEIRKSRTPSCDDIEGPDEKCSGCPMTPTSAYECIKAPLGSTWNKEVGLTGATGQCNNDPICTNEPDSLNGYSTPANANNNNVQYLCNATCDGEGNCAATKPEFCTDCYGKQYCTQSSGGASGGGGSQSATETSTSKYFIKTRVTGQSGGCGQKSGENVNVCAPDNFNEADSCSKDGYAVMEYSCKLGETPIYGYELKNCSDLDVQRDIPPTTQNSADGFIKTCSAGKISKCEKGACQTLASMTPTTPASLTEYCDKTKKKYTKIILADINKNGFMDSCSSINVDMDKDGLACVHCGYRWAHNTCLCS
jgi:hypothetical protein